MASNSCDRMMACPPVPEVSQPCECPSGFYEEFGNCVGKNLI